MNPLKTVYLFFAASRYWTDPQALTAAYKALLERISPSEAALIVDGTGMDALPSGDCLVVVPMSGAVQKYILDAAARYAHTVIYAAYVQGNAADSVTSEMLRCNAAPTVMDTWAVLKRTKPGTYLAISLAEVDRALQVLRAYTAIRGAKLLKIGETEPWVISNSLDPTDYQTRFSVEIERVPQSEVAARYRSMTDQDGQPYYDFFTANAQKCVEPNEQDLRNACRMAAALVQTMEAHHAQGCAIACFNLLQEGTNMCLGVSFINDCTDMLATCECDMDSALTMLMMKHLTKTHLWMANPGLQPDGTVNFSHCTAPIHACGGQAFPCTLRNHHESGIGVSLQIDLPVGQAVTACRLSDRASKITIQHGVSVCGAYECACRTQMHVRFDDPNHYLRTALGCHQVFAFEDIVWQMNELSHLLGLTVL